MLRVAIAAVMTRERLGVGHDRGHGTACQLVDQPALENDPKEIPSAAFDAQRIPDRLMAHERERSPERRRVEPQNGMTTDRAKTDRV